MSRVAEQITERVKMSDVLSLYGFQLKHGKMVCPFHREKTASFVVTRDDQKFTCFGCGASGDVIDFVMKIYNIRFNQAIVRIDNDFGLGLLGASRGYREQKAAAEKQLIRHKEKQALKKRKEFYLVIAELHRLMFEVVQDLKPKTIEEVPNDLYASAVVWLPVLERWLDENIGRMGVRG